jgi:hypothetical protein
MNLKIVTTMLTDSKIRSFEQKEKTYSKSDAHGLYIEIPPSGNRYWRMSYRIAGKQKRIAIGVYPEISLKEARDKRDELRAILKRGKDPAEVRKREKIELKENVFNTFESIAGEYLDKKKSILSNSYHFRIMNLLEANIFPYLGGLSIKRISPKELLAVVQKIEERGTYETAHRILQLIGQVFRYAIASGRAVYVKIKLRSVNFLIKTEIC